MFESNMKKGYSWTDVMCCCIPCTALTRLRLFFGGSVRPSLPNADDTGSLPSTSNMDNIRLSKTSTTGTFASNLISPFKKKRSSASSNSSGHSDIILPSSKEVKILLLGPGESGKSTIVKQMKIIHGAGYSKEELSLNRKDIYRNILEGMQQLIEAMARLSIQFHTEKAVAASSAVLEASHEDFTDGIPTSLYKDIAFLWNESGLKPLYDKLAQISYVICSAPYFFENISRICAPDYVPTQLDVLRARIKTTGISEARFKMGNLAICLIDVGGQISERKKWIHTFENVTSVIFCVSLSEYDQVLLEDPSQSRMLDSFLLFESIINSQWFRHTSIILFLNKTDIFRRKLVLNSLSRYFPDYIPLTSDPTNFDHAANFLKNKYLSLNYQKLPIYPHFTCATDTQQIETVFSAIKETILSNVLKNTGLL